MKKFFALAFVLCTSLAHAGEISVLDSSIPNLDPSKASVDARFYMDTQTKEGFVTVRVINEIRRSPERVFSSKVKVEGLSLVGDKIILQSSEGEIECGTMTTTRVFRRTAVVPSGRCELVGSIDGAWGERVVHIKLITK